jgi:hypothetical protein
MDLNTLGTHLERALMDRRRAVVFHTVGLLVLSLFITGCTPEPTEEDHPYYLDWQFTKDAIQQVIEARKDNLFVFPEQEPVGVNYIMSYTNALKSLTLLTCRRSLTSIWPLLASCWVFTRRFTRQCWNGLARANKSFYGPYVKGRHPLLGDALSCENTDWC